MSDAAMVVEVRVATLEAADWSAFDDAYDATLADLRFDDAANTEPERLAPCRGNGVTRSAPATLEDQSRDRGLRPLRQRHLCSTV